MRRLFSLSLPLCVLLGSVSFAADVGVLILATEGTPQWTKAMKKTVKEAEIPYPTRIFLGKGDTRESVEELQDDVSYLENKDVHAIIVIPLVVSSYSDVYRQWRYLLGVDIKPGFSTTMSFPLEHHADIQFSPPLNDEPIVSEILLDRVREISQAPEQESVIIVSNGPNDDYDNGQWLDIMKRVAERVKERGNFKTVQGMTLRDTAPPSVRAEAIRKLRDRVEAIDKEGGRALIVPLLMEPGGIENKIGVDLKGTDYVLNAKTLFPDRRLSQWIRSKAP